MNAANGSRLRFGDYELDARAGKLYRAGRTVKIQPQPLRVLAVLAERPSEIVSREELRRRIWDDATFVEFDQGVNYCIRQIRLALGDDASAPAYIETLPKHGYRFIAPVSVDAAARSEPQEVFTAPDALKSASPPDTGPFVQYTVSPAPRSTWYGRGQCCSRARRYGG